METRVQVDEVTVKGRTWYVRVDEARLVAVAIADVLGKTSPTQKSIRRFDGALVADEVPMPATPGTKGEAK